MLLKQVWKLLRANVLRAGQGRAGQGRAGQGEREDSIHLCQGQRGYTDEGFLSLISEIRINQCITGQYQWGFLTEWEFFTVVAPLLHFLLHQTH